MNLNINFLAVDFEAIKQTHSLLSILRSPKINKRIPFGLLGYVVAWNFDGVDCAVALKILSNITLIDMVHFRVIN